MGFISLCGIVGNLGFGFGCLSVAVRTVRNGNANDMPWQTAGLFLCANASFYTYLLGTYGADPFFFMLGFVETGSWALVVAYKIFAALRIVDFLYFD